jgi:hypothetical protein
MDTFLSPIEKPRGLMMKLAYYFACRQFGKVVTPLKVHSARLPPAFGLFYGKVAQLDKKLTLPPELIMLIREQVDRATFSRMSSHYSERQVCEIVWLVASEHLYNMTNIGLNIHSDMLCDISRMRQQRAA